MKMRSRSNDIWLVSIHMCIWTLCIPNLVNLDQLVSLPQLSVTGEARTKTNFQKKSKFSKSITVSPGWPLLRKQNLYVTIRKKANFPSWKMTYFIRMNKHLNIGTKNLRYSHWIEKMRSMTQDLWHIDKQTSHPKDEWAKKISGVVTEKLIKSTTRDIRKPH